MSPEEEEECRQYVAGLEPQERLPAVLQSLSPYLCGPLADTNVGVATSLVGILVGIEWARANPEGALSLSRSIDMAVHTDVDDPDGITTVLLAKTIDGLVFGDYEDIDSLRERLGSL